MPTAKFLPYKISFLLCIFSEQIAHIRVQSHHHTLAGGKAIIKENAKVGAIVGEKGRRNYPKGLSVSSLGFLQISYPGVGFFSFLRKDCK